MTYWRAVWMGAIYGITELFPLSGSGHIAVLNQFLRWGSRSEQLMFTAFLHLGVVLAVMISYRKEFRTLRKQHSGKTKAAKRKKRNAAVLQMRTRLMLGFAMLPVLAAVVASIFLDSLYERRFFLAFMFLLSGGLVFLSARNGHGNRAEKNMTIGDALLVGAAHMSLAVPGLSQMGCGISVGTMCGLDRRYSMKFSLLLQVPASLCQCVCLAVRGLAAGVVVSQLPMYLVGMGCAFAAGLAACYGLQVLMQKGKLEVFSYYCWGAGLVTLILSSIS